MANPTRTRRWFTAQQKAEAVELCLQEGLSCNAVAERLGLPCLTDGHNSENAVITAQIQTVFHEHPTNGCPGLVIEALNRALGQRQVEPE